VLSAIAVLACASVASGGAAPSPTAPTVGTVVAKIHVISPKGLLVTPGAVWVGAAPAPNGTIWVSEHSGLPHPRLWMIDPTTNTLVGQVDLGNVTSTIDDIAFSADGTVWSALFDADVVMRIKPS
jgi:hypothetical protein